jgi:hypothetical protein
MKRKENGMLTIAWPGNNRVSRGKEVWPSAWGRERNCAGSGVVLSHFVYVYMLYEVDFRIELTRCAQCRIRVVM